MPTFQKAGCKNLDRKDHIWVRQEKRWKCVLCGAVVQAVNLPPSYPTSGDFVPERFEELTAAERSMCPAPTIL